MKRALDALREELSAVRAGRASTAILENLTVDAYGSKMPLSQVASLNVPEPRLITVQPWDKSIMKGIEKAIRDSDLGLNPVNDGAILRVPLPELTEERRKELVKMVHKYGEQHKITVRGVRRDGVDQLRKMEKNKEISRDELRMLEKKVQEGTDLHIKEVEQVIAAKEADIMQV